MRGTRLSARTRRSSMQVAGADANRRDTLEGSFEDGSLVACMAVISSWQGVCSFLKRRCLVPLYAGTEDCAGWAGAEPHASGTSHAAGVRSLCRSRHFQDEDLS